MRKHGWYYQIGTHTSQANPQEMREKALAFLNKVKCSLIVPPNKPQFVHSIDRTTVPYSQTVKKLQQPVEATP